MSAEYGLIHDLPEEDYHAHPALSQSQIKVLLDCPARYRWQRDHPQPHRKAFDVGHAAHSLILGAGLAVVEVEADSWRTKSAQAQRDEAYAAGHVPLLAHEAQAVRAMHEAVMGHPAARLILERDGAPEVSMFWQRDDEIAMRGRMDRLTDLPDGRPVIVDLKTTVSASPRRFARSVYDFGYHIQQAAYVDGLSTITGADEVVYLLLAVEKEPPCLTAVYTLDDIACEIGEDEYARGLDIYRRCTETGTWPGYGADDITTLPSPRWAR